MKKFLVMLLIAVFSMNVCAQSFVVKDNNIYTSVSSKKKTEGKKTPYTYEARDGQKYPICVNEYLSGTPDGTIHDWEEIHKCENCGKESYFSNGCF